MKLSLLSKAVILSICYTNFAIANNIANKDGLWVGAGLGAGHLEESIKGKNKTGSNGFSSKTEIGYDFNNYIGAYGSYDYMHYILSDKIFGIGTLGLKIRYSLTDNVSFFGKVGGKVGVSYNGDGIFSTAGLGLEYQLTHAISTKIGVDYYNNLNISANRTGNLSQVYWGMSYRFGQPSTPMVIKELVEVPVEVIVEVIKEVPTNSDIVKSTAIIFSAGNDKLFENNSSDLTSTASFIGPLNSLKNDPLLNITITGHADSVGTEQYNQFISIHRAESVSDYFKSNGILSSRITVIGKGEAEPITSNKTELGRSQNRRVELLIK